MATVSGSYRPEIDGLRAIAVLFVVLNHAGLWGFEGGFLGVDVFFVISGFLITGIIFRGLSDKTFSISSFYERRIRRILPALYVSMLLSSVAAWFLMLPDDLENFGQSIIATVAFANNVLLLLTSGYWTLAADFKPLMHTWSLGVEEQYYLVMPLLLGLTFFAGRLRSTLAVTLAIFLSSLIFSLWISKSMPEADYLLLTSRAWEISAGALASLLLPKIEAVCGKPAAQQLAALGLLLIFSSLALYNILPDNLPKLHIASIAAVSGSVLILACADAKAGVGRLLAARPAVFTGLLSYSIYLYHQPVFAFVRISSLSEPGVMKMLAFIPAIFLLAWASWHFVERPFRNPLRLKTRIALPIIAAASALLLLVGGAMYGTSGFIDRWPELAGNKSMSGMKHSIAYNERVFSYSDRRFETHAEKVQMLVMGHSFARDFINMAIETPATQNMDLAYSSVDYCRDGALTALKENIRRADYVVLGSSGDDRYVACVVQLVKTFKAMTRAKILVLGPKNFGWNNNAVMLFPESSRYAYRAKPLQLVLDQNERTKAAVDASTYIDILKSISDRNGRVPVFTPDRKFLSEDGYHLTKAGAAYLGPIIFAKSPLREVAEAIKRKGAAPAGR